MKSRDLPYLSTTISYSEAINQLEADMKEQKRWCDVRFDCLFPSVKKAVVALRSCTEETWSFIEYHIR